MINNYHHVTLCFTSAFGSVFSQISNDSCWDLMIIVWIMIYSRSDHYFRERERQSSY